MFLITSLILHFDALTRLVCPASFLRSCASFSVRMPFSSSLLMSESADWARTLVMHSIKAIEPTAKCLNIRFDFIVGWFLVVLHTGTLGRTRYEDASHLLRFCDKGRTSQALPGTLDTVLLQKRREFATSARHLCSQMKLKIL